MELKWDCLEGGFQIFSIVTQKADRRCVGPMELKGRGLGAATYCRTTALVPACQPQGFLFLLQMWSVDFSWNIERQLVVRYFGFFPKVRRFKWDLLSSFSTFVLQNNLLTLIAQMDYRTWIFFYFSIQKWLIFISKVISYKVKSI